MGAPGGEWAASIRTGAKEEGACRVELELHCFDLNGTDVSGVCPGQISGNRAVGGGLGQGAGPPASSIPEHCQHPLHVPGT